MFSPHAHLPPKSRVAGLAPAAILVLLAAALAGCSGDTVRTLAADAGYGPKVVAAPDFVAESRGKQAPDFMAVGVDAPRRPARAKSTEGQKALEAELEGVRGRNEARGRAAEAAGKGTGKQSETPSGSGATGTGPAAQ